MNTNEIPWWVVLTITFAMSASLLFFLWYTPRGNEICENIGCKINPSICEPAWYIKGELTVQGNDIIDTLVEDKKKLQDENRRLSDIVKSINTTTR